MTICLSLAHDSCIPLVHVGSATDAKMFNNMGKPVSILLSNRPWTISTKPNTFTF